MPPPKRPFTTSSLTSSLKSTFANQPLLSNLTNLDKLTSTASNLAHKAPFFDALNEQFQQARAQDTNRQQHPAGSETKSVVPPNQSSNQNDTPDFRSAIGNHQRVQGVEAPNVDMSHLTEQERLMIQSVIAKAEQTNTAGAPSSTTIPNAMNMSSHMNLPNMQQQQQQQQQQMQQQQMHQNQQHPQQPQMHNQPANNMIAQPYQQSNMQQVPAQNVASYQQAPVQQLQQPNYQQSSMMNPGQQPGGAQMANLPGMNSQAQAQQTFGNQQSSMSSSFDRANTDRFGIPQQAGNLANQPQQMQQQQQQPQQNFTQSGSQDPSRMSLAQQTQQLVNQINSQFSLGANARDTMQAPLQPSQNLQQNFNAQQPIQGAGANMRPQMTNLMATNSLAQQAAPYGQTQLPGQYIQPQQDSLATNQHLAMNAPQRFQSMQQGGQLGGNPSSQLANLAQQNPAFYNNMQSQNVIGQLIPINQSEANFQQLALQQQQPMLFQDTGNLPCLDPTAGFAANNLINMNAFNQQNAPIQGRQQLYDTQLNVQPESILRYRDAREGIRFRPDTFRDDYAMSDQETHDDRRSRGRTTRRMDDRSLRRYDSLEAGTRSRLVGRERSRELKGTLDRSTPTMGLGKQRQLPKLGETTKQVVQQQQAASGLRKARATPPMKRSRSLRRDQVDRELSPSVTSDSELDDASFTLSETSQDRKSRKPQRVLDKRIVSLRQPSATSSRADHQPDERAINRIGELKLSDQASQVMEQQQLLIQQSQELIKLQQTQLENQSKNKEAQVQPRPQSVGPTAEQLNNTVPSLQRGPELNRQISLDVRDSMSSKNAEAKEPPRDAGNQTHEMQKPAPMAINKATSIDSTDLINIESDSVDIGHRVADHRLKKVQKNIRGLGSLEKAPQPKYIHDLLISPTDTTDSDIELLSHRGSVRRHQRGQLISQARPSRASQLQQQQAHRRGPTGLPPSPLPVGAAIQLHQLQQKHEPPMSRTGKIGRQAFLRSKSVCNSPDFTNSREHFSRSIDASQQINSPDTLSELGGRRKRLPEPPSNSVPLTPLMVRKMIQAQNAAATNSGKLLTSVNAQSTLLTNMHSSRNPCFDRAPNEHLRHIFDHRGQSSYSPMSAYLGRSTDAGMTSAPVVSFVDPRNLYGTSRVKTDQSRYDPQTKTMAMLGSGSSRLSNVPSNYGSGSILKPAKFQGSSESAELDGMIRDISARYDSMNNQDGQLGVGVSSLSGQMSRYDQLIQQQQQRPDRLHTSSYQSPPSNTRFTPKPTYPLGDHLYGGSSNFRRSSEGESPLMARLGRSSSPYTNRLNRICSEQGGGAYSTVSPSRFRESAYKSAQLPQSPLKSQISRHRRFDEYHPNSRHGSPLRPSGTSSSKYPSRWPTSQLESTATLQAGISLDGLDSSEFDDAQWSSSGPRRYANFRPDRFSGLYREVPQDRILRRGDSYLDRVTDINRLSSTRYPTSSGIDSSDRVSRLGCNNRHHYRSLDLDAL